MFNYIAFGLHIASEIEFPELFPDSQTNPADVSITIGKTPENLTAGKIDNVELWITPEEYLIHYKDIGWYYASNGKEIIVQPCSKSDPKLIRLYLLSNAMAAIIHQRKLIPFHASGIFIKGGIALITGPSGSGKSTTLKALTTRGHKIFTDDVCVLKEKDETILATPSYPMIKLWKESFDLLSLGDEQRTHGLYQHSNKFGVFFHDQFVSSWEPPLKIFNIEKLDSAEKVTLSKPEGSNAFKLIGENTYRNHYVEAMKLNSLHFKLVSGLVKQCDVFTLTRPLHTDSISQIVSMIEDQIQ